MKLIKKVLLAVGEKIIDAKKCIFLTSILH